MDTVNHDELAAVRDLAERFAAKELSAESPPWDRYPFVDFPRDLADKAASIGFFMLPLPEEAGGAGLGMTALSGVVEALAGRDASLSLIVVGQCLAREFLASHAADPVVERWVNSPGDAAEMIALPLYDDPEEPARGIEASPDQGDYVLTGSLDYVALLPEAGAALVPVVNESGVAWFLVETGRQGVMVSEPVVSLGLRACPAADLRLDRVRVPENNRLNAEAARGFIELTDRYRGPLAAIALGILKGCYNKAKSYAEERYQARKQIIEHDMVRRMLAEMAAWIDMGTVAIYGACAMVDREDRGMGTPLLSIQELMTRAVTRAVTDGVQVLGGYGYMREFGQEKRMRDAKQLQAVFGGSPLRTLRLLERRLGS